MVSKNAAQRQRDIQSIVDSNDRESDGSSKKNAMQAGHREYPEPLFSKQHQCKPGDEAALDPAPMYDNPHYKGSEKLKIRSP